MQLWSLEKTPLLRTRCASCINLHIWEHVGLKLTNDRERWEWSWGWETFLDLLDRHLWKGTKQVWTDNTDHRPYPRALPHLDLTSISLQEKTKGFQSLRQNPQVGPSGEQVEPRLAKGQGPETNLEEPDGCQPAPCRPGPSDRKGPTAGFQKETPFPFQRCTILPNRWGRNPTFSIERTPKEFLRWGKSELQPWRVLLRATSRKQPWIALPLMDLSKWGSTDSTASPKVPSTSQKIQVDPEHSPLPNPRPLSPLCS